MAGTRFSVRQAVAKSSSSKAPPPSKPAAAAGTKRKAESEAPAKGKRGKKGAKKEQTTIEASMASDDKNGDSKEDVEMKEEQEAEPAEASNATTGIDEVAQREEEVRDQELVDEEKNEEPSAEKKEPETNGDVKENGEELKKSGFDALMDHTGKDEDKNATEEGTGSKVSKAENAVEDSPKREEAVPSNILEKGVIYFFFRGRVGINEPTDVNDIARSYIVLRPLPHGAKLGDGPIGDAGNNRMLALPKKVLPVSSKDRFMTFVEKANISMDDIKSQLSSSDYSTKTVGVRHTPAAAPIGEGVYAITQTGRETHLAYILTIPSELGEIQQVRTFRSRSFHLVANWGRTPNVGSRKLYKSSEFVFSIH